MDKRVSKYPAQFDVAYPRNPLSRFSTFFRIFFAIPAFTLLILLARSVPMGKEAVSFGGILFLAPLLMILFRKKYPRWWFDWNLEFSRFLFRVYSYLFLLRDEYPSTDEHQEVYLKLVYPDAKKLNRWLPLVKWFLAIPHVVILVIFSVITLIFVILAWFAILFTARYPRFLFDFVVGYLRWTVRVQAYALLLITDKYPPFSLYS